MPSSAAVDAGKDPIDVGKQGGEGDADTIGGRAGKMELAGAVSTSVSAASVVTRCPA